MTEQKYTDFLDEEVQTSGGGGGMVGKIKLLGGFQCYVSGLSPADRIFTYASKDEKAAAKAKAEALYTQHNIEKQPEQTLVIIQYKDSILGRDVSTWKGDRLHTYGPNWGPDCKKLNELRVALNLKPNVETWARMGSMVSPNAEANQEKDWAWENNQDGVKQLKRMQVPVQLYASKEEAEAGVEDDTETVSDPSFPGGDWSLDGWNACKPDIIETAKKGVKQGIPAAVTYGELAVKYEVTPEQIQLVVEAA